MLHDAGARVITLGHVLLGWGPSIAGGSSIATSQPNIVNESLLVAPVVILMSSTLWRTRVTASLDHAVSSRLRVVLKPYAATGRHKELVSSRNVMGCKQPWNLHPSKVRPGANFLPQSGTAIVAVLGQDLPLILYEALVAAILAILILYYQQRPRGWSARDLVQVGPHASLALCTSDARGKCSIVCSGR